MASRRSGIRRAAALALLGSASCLWVPTPATAASNCTGDCNGNGTVEINELVTCVNIALDTAAPSTCAACDANGDSRVTIDELIAAVSNALTHCGQVTVIPTPTDGGPTPTATPMPTSGTPLPTCPLQPGAYTLTSLDGGMLKIGTFAAFPFPAGSTTVIDVGQGDGNCVHEVVVPSDGFRTPTFCFPATGFTVQVTQSGCGIGEIDSDGGADFTITELGDTSYTSPACMISQGGNCPSGGPPPDSNIAVQITVGDGQADRCASGATGNAIVAIPVNTLTWLAADGSCPDADGRFDPDDTFIVSFPQILDFTTDTNTAKFQDLDGDGCSKSGAGPAAGLSSSGACMDITKLNTGERATTIAASGTVGSVGRPYDLVFTTTSPNKADGPAAPLHATCDPAPDINFEGSAIRCVIAPTPSMTTAQ
jgi:hypothetical protein